MVEGISRIHPIRGKGCGSVQSSSFGEHPTMILVPLRKERGKNAGRTEGGKLSRALCRGQNTEC